MKSFKKLVIGIILCIAAIYLAINLWLVKKLNTTENRPYMVEISRLANKLADAEIDTDNVLQNLIHSSNCKYVKKIVFCENNEGLTASSPYDSCIKEVDGKLYRFYYERENSVNYVLIINLILVGVSVMIALILIFVGRKIIIPFHRMEEIPYELSKGNLAMDLPEEKTKFFGRFIWGTNMLKENLEERRKKELGMHKEKKLLLLSLTHDIKTPLSVIKLNAQALEKNLYKDEARKLQAAKDIHVKADEIEQYVSDIVAASREDFIDLSVKEEEFYLVDLIDKITEYYKAKLELKKTEFLVEEHSNCLLSGDFARIMEVLQNLIENAIKYGDGNRLRLSFEQDQGCQLITVSNTGKPMKQEEIIKIFDSFYRGSNVGNKDGSGLGLYICRQLMKNMNGDIFVKQTEEEFQVTVVVRMS